MPPLDPAALDPTLIFRVVDLTGVLASGLLGGALARAKRFDVVGFVIIAIVSALGGGILRDVMLGTGRPVALTDATYLGSAVAAATTAYVVEFRGRWSRRTLIGLDALALGCWSATGAAKALDNDLGVLSAVFLGFVTAVGGGILRDVLVGEVPRIFTAGNPLYATFSVLGATELVVAQRLGHPPVGMAASILSCGVLVLLARRFGWALPAALEVRSRRRRTRSPGSRSSGD